MDSPLKCCRICTNTSKANKFVNIFSSELIDNYYCVDGVSLAKAFSDLMHIECSNNDGLPKYFCEVCRKRLVDAFYLWKQALESHENFMKEINMSTSNKLMNDIIYIKDEEPGEFVLKTENLEQDAVSFLLGTCFDDVLDKASDGTDFEQSYFSDGQSNSIPKSQNTDLKSNQIKESARKKSLNRSRRTMIKNQHYDLPPNDDRNKLVCETCGKTFSQKCNLLDHLRSHANIRLFECNSCDKKFVRLIRLKYHMRDHMEVKPYNCTTCEKSYSHKHLLNKHMITHNPNRNYACKICGKTFKTSYAVKVHQRAHNINLHVKCKYCDKTFSYMYNLKVHTLSVHKGIKLYRKR